MYESTPGRKAYFFLTHRKTCVSEGPKYAPMAMHRNLPWYNFARFYAQANLQDLPGHHSAHYYVQTLNDTRMETYPNIE